MALYSVNNYSIESLLGFIKGGDIAIPEIQRPFVWDSSKVRDLIDSLYHSYPIGYIIVWQNPDVKLKDGTVSVGRKVLIDGQQRITALTAAIVGQPVVGDDYRTRRIKIAFNPLTEAFEVSNNALEKSPAWIPDISVIFDPSFRQLRFLKDYQQANGLTDEQIDTISETTDRLRAIQHNALGVIVLDQNLDIDTVTEIFIRINSKGVVLSQADFAMSKIASNTQFGGNLTRKMIDYFCHLLQKPGDLNLIHVNDIAFGSTPEFAAIRWVAEESEDIYLPDYSDVLRVAFTAHFQRGRLSDLVSLLSGRNFEAREYLEEIARDSFEKLHRGVYAVVNQTNFQRYIMILKSLGMANASLIRSQNVLNFGYILFIALREKGINSVVIEKAVRRWILYTILTGRYSGAPESNFDYDIKRLVAAEDPLEYIDQVEAGELSEAFWNNLLPMRMNTSVATSPYFNVFLMAQAALDDRGFLSEQIRVKHMLDQRGDIHHLFPKAYLIKHGINGRGDYNQIANYVYIQQDINISIRDASPHDYMHRVLADIDSGTPKLCGIQSLEDLRANMEENCIPEGFENMTVEDYSRFLEARRILMAQKIRRYFESLH